MHSLLQNLARTSRVILLAHSPQRMASTTSAPPHTPSQFLASPAFLRHGVLHFPVAHMRGGTSTGVVLWAPHLAPFGDLRDEIIRKIMGVPGAGEAKGNKQITGLGRGASTSNKVGAR
jgi:hypothetical protein